MKPYKTTWSAVANTHGMYLVLAGSNSVWAGFKSKKQAETCLLVLPGWKFLNWK
jgi:hypothetical protein